jgi:hypothetical protein
MMQPFDELLEKCGFVRGSKEDCRKKDRPKKCDRSDDKIGARVGWWFAGSARYPSNPSGIT